MVLIICKYKHLLDLYPILQFEMAGNNFLTEINHTQTPKTCSKSENISVDGQEYIRITNE